MDIQFNWYRLMDRQIRSSLKLKPGSRAPSEPESCRLQVPRKASFGFNLMATVPQTDTGR
jgi:hypothetical protein